MNAKEAREALEAGKKIRLTYWNEGEFIYAIGDAVLNNYKEKFSVYPMVESFFIGYDTWELYEEPKITLREGCCYRTKNGKVTTVLVAYKQHNDEGYFAAWIHGEKRCWLPDGTHKYGNPELNLVEEIMKPLVMREGAYYKTRAGRITDKGLEKRESTYYPWLAQVNGIFYKYDKNGHHITGHNGTYLDLVEEVPAPVKLEVGKTYVDGQGKKREITETIIFPNETYYSDKNGNCYLQNGKWFQFGGISNDNFNLVAECKEPTAEAPKPVLEEGKKQNFLGKETFGCDNGYQVDASDQINEVNKRLSQTYQAKPLVLREDATDGQFASRAWATRMLLDLDNAKDDMKIWIGNLAFQLDKVTANLQQQINKLSFESGVTAGKLDKHIQDTQQALIDDPDSFIYTCLKAQISGLAKRLYDLEEQIAESDNEPKTGDFAYALKLMREGKMVRRTSWNNKDYCIYFDGIPPMSSDPIILYNSDLVTKVLYPIHLSDFIATDWEEYKDAEKL